jgi:hypothetical protein
MAVTIGSSGITFNDSSIQTTKPMKLLGEVSNTATGNGSHSFYGLSAYNQLVLVWNGTQYSGPAGSSLTLTEGTTSVLFTTSATNELLLTTQSLNTVTRVQQASNSSNLLTSFSGGNSFWKGRVVMTKIRNMSATLPQMWNVSIEGGTSTNYFAANLAVGTPTLSASGFSLDSINLNLGLTNLINIRLYGTQ